MSIAIALLATIVIDGQFQDWPENQTEVVDDRFVHRQILLEEPGCLQQLPRPLNVDIGDVHITFSPRETGYGVAVSRDGVVVSPYEIGLVFAPTTASSRFEIRIDRPGATRKPVSFDLADAGGTRVVSWNVQFGNLLDDKVRGTRILRSLRPDILLLQELDGNDSPGDVAAFLGGALGGTWTVIMSPLSGERTSHRLRSAVATTLPATPLPAPQPVANWPIKVAAAKIALGQRTLTAVSVHLRCCGGPDGEAEQQRQEEAMSIRRSLASHAGPLVIAGDWNLVGTRRPLEILQRNDMVIVEAPQPDGLLTATWSDATSAFTPGRLDWMLVRTPIRVERAFVLDSADLDDPSLAAGNLRSGDTAALSDHLPLVADLVLVEP
ncbi:MAG: endonuclease/exonuclease/phosphatase family protein [Phycisphaerales bacterium]|nr:endonuclease/exonuclease/phosphatase family protein [Phycisphaerales bacterium]